MKVYILKHPDSKYSGNVLGVSFDNGIGSTCSQTDAQFCVQKKGCKDVTDDYEAKVDEKKALVTNYVPKKKKGKGKGKEKEAPEDEKTEPAEPEKK